MLKMAMQKEETDDWGSCKCGEITTLLSIGKKEFFLSCDLCDFRIQKLDLFIKHVYRNHLHVFTQANSRPTSTEFVAQHSDEETTNEWNDMVVEEVDSKEHILDDFEKVVIDINEGEMVDPIQEDTMMCFKVEELSEEYANEYAEELNPAEFLEDECIIERIEEDAALPDEFDVKKREEERLANERRHFTLEFIKLYRALPGLWNVKNKYYHNQMIKNEQYRTLLNKYREMYPKAQLQDVKEMIKCLRLNYDKERRDVQRNGTEPKLYYYKEISFLAGTESHSNSKQTVDDSDAMEISYDLTDDTLAEEYLEAYEQPKPSKQPKRSKAYRDSADRRFHLEFIKLYKSYPSLWDPKDPDYKDQELRKINYKELLEKYKERYPNAVVLDVRKKINCLRTNYNHELKRFLNTGVKSKSYYFEAMSFLNNNESKEIASKEMENDVHNTEMPSDVIDGDTLSEEYLETCEEVDFQDTQFNSIQNVKEKKKRVQQFTDEEKFILEFIDLYKSMPSLWNKNAPDYYDLEAKNINYQILLEKFNEHYPDAVLQDVKKKINILRTNYKRTMKKISSGQPLQTKCFYIEAMHFLQNNELESDTKATDNDLHDMEMSVEAVADDTQSEEYLETSSICEDTTLLTHTKDTQRTQNVTKNVIRVKSETDEQKFLFEFIALYESLPALWNVNVIEYCDRELKKLQYQILLEKYKEIHPTADVNDVKKRINSLRTNYRRELRKGPPHGLFYFDKLNFLRELQIISDDFKGDTPSNNCLETSNKSGDATPKKTQFRCKRTPQYNVFRKRDEYTLNKERQFLFEFIDMYHELPALWNVNIKDYNNREIKDAQYQLLLEKYNEKYPKADADEMKRKINTLRSNYRRELKRGPPYSLFYFEKMNFLVDTQATTDATPNKPSIQLKNSNPNPKSMQRKDSSLTDEQFIHLVKAYESYPTLWDWNKIEYLFSNRRREARQKLLEEFNKAAVLKLTKDVLNKEISLLKQICSNEKKQKIRCKQENIPHEVQLAFNENIAFLENHVPPFECGVCNEILPGYRVYQVHVATHNGSPPFKCNICQHGFRSLSNMTIHLRRHTHDFTYNCDVCHASFPSNTNYKNHMLTHTGYKPLVCHICGMGFRDKTSLKYHVRHHEQLPSHKCQICSKAFFFQHKLKMHHIAVHLKLRNVICDVCNKGFATKRHLRQHTKIHNVKKYVCKICGKRYAQAAGLNWHMKSSHAVCKSTKNQLNLKSCL